MAKAKKKPTFINTKPLAENYVFIYQGQVQSVDVGVHINYAERYISLIDVNKQNPAAAQNNAKSWAFKRRELEYMAGWCDIIDAMKAAVLDAEARLTDYCSLEDEAASARVLDQVAKMQS